MLPAQKWVREEKTRDWVFLPLLNRSFRCKEGEEGWYIAYLRDYGFNNAHKSLFWGQKWGARSTDQSSTLSSFQGPGCPCLHWQCDTRVRSHWQGPQLNSGRDLAWCRVGNTGLTYDYSALEVRRIGVHSGSLTVWYWPSHSHWDSSPPIKCPGWTSSALTFLEKHEKQYKAV